MRVWYFFGIFLILIGFVCADEVSNDRGFFDVIVDFFKNIFSGFTGKAIVGISPIPATGEWWNSSWRYRVGVEVDLNGYNRVDWPVEVPIDFRDKLDSLGDSAAFDIDSVRVVEYNSSGYILGEVKSDFEIKDGEEGLVIFILNGSSDGSKVRDFLIYFESVENKKNSVDYASLVDYDFSGGDIFLDNGIIDIRIDSARGENAAGIYYAERLDSSKVIFNVGVTERPGEYLRFYNGSDYFGVDLDGDAFLDFNGSVKKVVLQSGDEVLWGTTSSSGNKIFRKYTMYDGSPWIYMEHVFSNGQNVSVSRRSDGVGVPSFDVERVFGIDNLIGPGGAGADPFSWKSVTKSAGAFGVGVINIEENGTTNYFTQGSVFSGVIGIQLGSTIIDPGENISNKIAVYFNNDSSHDGVSGLKDRLEHQVVLNVGNSEEYVVISNLSTEFSIYNLNESVLVNLEILNDSHNLANRVNVSFDMGTISTADDFVLELLDDGISDDGVAGDGVYGGRYNLSVDSNLGVWNVSAKVYDEYWQVVDSRNSFFNVSNFFKANLTVLNFAGLGGRDIFAEFNLKNIRNDSGVSAVVDCFYNGTNIVNIFETSLGNYVINFSAPSVIGSYLINCSGVSFGNIGFDNDWFYVEPDKTNIDYDFIPLNKTISDISQAKGGNFSVYVNISNVGDGFSPDSNISLTLPNSDFISNVSLVRCGSLGVRENCSGSFFINILQGANPGNYNLSLNISWINPDLTLGYSVKNLSVLLVSNAVFNLSEFNFDSNIGEGMYKSYGNFSVDSIGNDNVLDLDFGCAHGEICDNFSVVFVPRNFSLLSGGNSVKVEIFIGVPEGYDEGNYSGVVGVGSSNAGIKTFSINVSVGRSGSWEISRVSCYDVVLVESAGDVCEVVVNNSGNMDLNFSVVPFGGNYTYVVPQNFSVKKQKNFSFYIRYNTSGAPPSENFILDYVLNVEGGEPTSRIVNVSLDVVFGPEVWVSLINESEQGEGFFIKANVSDRSASGIGYVRANITRPSGGVDVVDLSNISSVDVGGYSQWEVVYENNLERGVYNIEVYAVDLSGGSGRDNSSLMVFAKLNISLKSGWNDYLLGESGTIYYSIKDYSDVGLVADVNISVKDSEGYVRFSKSYVSENSGLLSVLPSFDIASDSVVGKYAVEAFSVYDDLVSGKRIFSFDNFSFDVYDYLFISLDSSVTWYPDSVMAFYLLVYSTSKMSVLPSDVNLVVYDPAQAQYTSASFENFSVVNQDNNSILYLYKYAMPANSPTGDFLARVSVKEGSRSFQDVQSFRVSSGGPFDLILNLSVVDVSKGEVVPFDITMKNMGEVSQDVYLDYWVSDASGNNYSKVNGEAIFVPAMGNNTISRTLPIYNNQHLGEHFIYVRMNYSKIIGPITTSKNFFVIDSNGSVKPKPGSGGGGGGDSVVSEFVLKKNALIILGVDPNELEIERGGVAYIMVEMKNNLDWDLESVSGVLSFDGVRVGGSGVLDVLPMGEKAILPIRIDIEKDFVSGFYNGELRIFSGDVESVLNYSVAIFDSKAELLSHRVSRLKNRIENLRVKTVQADENGFDVGVIFDFIQNISSDFDLLEVKLTDRMYLDSLRYLDDIENKIEKSEYELGRIVDGDGYSWIGILVGFVILIFVILIIILIVRIRYFLARFKFERLRRKYVKGVRKKRLPVRVAVKNDGDYLKTLREQYKYGYISKDTYDEARKKI